MKVLLISTNQLRPSEAQSWIPVVPLGLAYVAAALRQAGHRVHLLDLCFEKEQERCVAGAISGFQPDVIGISFRNLEMMAYFRNVSFLGDLLAVVGICRSESDAVVILGGSGFSLMPEEILNYTGAPMGVVGEGEWAMPEVLSKLESGDDVRLVAGLVLRDGERTGQRSQGYGTDLAFLPTPARDLIDHARYTRAGGTANVQSKRGCPFGCIYCTYPVIEGRHVRCRPPEQVAEEFGLLAGDLNVRDVYVVDSQFNSSLDHAKQVCEQLIARRKKAGFRWTCMLNPGRVDDELVLMLRLAGCTMVDLGVDAGSDHMLEKLGKGFSVGDVENTLRLLRRNGLAFNTWMLLGGPGETEETVRQTVDFAVKNQISSVLFSIGIRICPRTKLEDLACREGRIGNGDSLLEPVFYLSLDADSIVDLVRPYCRGRTGWHIAALPHPDEMHRECGTSKVPDSP